jgi:hypothetical protein
VSNTYIIQFIGFILVLSSCQLQEKMKCEVTSIVELTEVPSASGIEHVGDEYFVVGDNSSWLYVLDRSFNMSSKFSLGTYAADDRGVITKSKKHDFEAMTKISWKGKLYLVVFGSGSKKPHRFEGIIIDLQEKNTLRTFSIQKLYDHIRDEAKLEPSELNIEAAAEVNGKLYLLNRGKNKLIVMNVEHFMEFIHQKSAKLKLKVYSIDLPEINDIRAGFSGAAGDQEHNRIVFTASVEDTDDWVRDGEILGSYLGVIDLENIQQHYRPETVQLVGKDKREKFKVESITIVESQGEKMNCVLVTDNDGLNSELLTISIDFH